MRFLFLLSLLSLGAAACAQDTLRNNTKVTQSDSIAAAPFPDQVPGITPVLDFLRKNLLETALIESCLHTGKIYLSFMVNKEGEIKDVSLQQGDCIVSGEKLAKQLKDIPRCKPSTANGKPVDMKFTIPVYID